jgi:hypothetical protein
MNYNLKAFTQVCTLGVVAALAGCNASSNIDGTCSSTFITDYNNIVTQKQTLEQDIDSLNSRMRSYEYSPTISTYNSIIDSIDVALASADEVQTKCTAFLTIHAGASCTAMLGGSEQTIYASTVEESCKKIRQGRNDLAASRAEL